MGKNSRCKKCGILLHKVKDMTPYGDHGWMFFCCNIPYYRCNCDTCHHPHDTRLFFYQSNDYLKKHIEKYHENPKEEEEHPILLDEYMHGNISATSYEESSSIGRYFMENCSIQDNFSIYLQQCDSIKNIIAMACNQSRGVMTVSKQI